LGGRRTGKFKKLFALFKNWPEPKHRDGDEKKKKAGREAEESARDPGKYKQHRRHQKECILTTSEETNNAGE